MTDEAELFATSQEQRKKIQQMKAIRIYTPYLSTVLYHMAGNSLPKEDIEEIVADVFVVLWKEMLKGQICRKVHYGHILLLLPEILL